MNTQTIEYKLRRMNIEKLRILQMFVNNSIVTTSAIGQATDTATDDFTSLGGIISSLSRIKDEKGKQLVIPMGRDSKDGMRWKLNEDIITKKKLKKLLEEMSIKELKKYKIQK